MNYPPGVTGNEPEIIGQPEIDWELDEIIEKDVDGSGTRSVSLYGTQPDGNGFYEYEVTAVMLYPYDDFEEIEDVECKGYVPNEPE